MIFFVAGFEADVRTGLLQIATFKEIRGRLNRRGETCNNARRGIAENLRIDS